MVKKQYTDDFLAHEVEGLYFDRKSARLKANDIYKPIIAFANAGGGILAIGIEDDGKITGINSATPSIEDYMAVINKSCKPIPDYEAYPIYTEYGQVVYIFDIKMAIDEVIRDLHDKVYLRIGDSSKELSYHEIVKLEQDKGRRCFEDKTSEAILEDLDKSLIDRYKSIHKVEGLDTTLMLKARGLMKQDGKITNGALLLFGKNPTAFLPSARIKFVKYNGTTAETGIRLNIIKEATFDQAIPILFEEVIKFISTQVRDFQTLSNEGIFISTSEYPEFAWKEGIINALAHRDYSNQGNFITIKMYDNRLEILSPGRLPNIVTTDNMKYTRYSRNPKIARVLSEFGYIKEMNEGVTRIYQEMEAYFLPEPQYSEPNQSAVQLILENNILIHQLNNVSRIKNKLQSIEWQSLSKYKKLALQMLCNVQSQVKTRDFSKYANISQTYAKRILSELEAAGMIKLVRDSINDPNQYYTMNI